MCTALSSPVDAQRRGGRRISTVSALVPAVESADVLYRTVSFEADSDFLRHAYFGQRAN